MKSELLPLKKPESLAAITFCRHHLGRILFFVILGLDPGIHDY